MNTIEQLAEELKANPLTVRKWIKSKRIKAIKLGNHWRVSDEELERIKREGLLPREEK